MTTYGIKPPESFDVHHPENWTKWSKRFEQFRVASGLSGAVAAKQVSTFLYCFGESAEDLLSAMGATDADRATYAGIKERFDTYFKVRHNAVYERACFNRRIQQQGESAEDFIVAVHTMADRCEFGADWRDELIRDRLVVGIRDVELSEKLQLTPTLTLAEAVKQIRQREAVHGQQVVLREGDTRDNPVVLDALKSGKQRPPKPTRRRYPGKQGSANSKKQCGRCGGTPHSRNDCPARDAECHRCGKKGHYRSHCLTKSVPVVNPPANTDSVTLEENYLDTLTDLEQSPTSWTTTVRVNSTDILFKLDTGAEVTAISKKAFLSIENTPELHNSSRLLYGPEHKPLSVVGQLSATLQHESADSTCNQQIFVVEGLTRNLLGLPAIVALGLIARVDNTEEVTNSTAELLDAYPKVFQGLGEFGEPYCIKLVPDAVPHAIFTPRRIPIPYREKVKEELSRMEEQGVISRVDGPTKWCSGMVAIPKKNGAVRICVDLQKLNKSVLREVHPLPRVDETLGLLAGATVFSKLDANSGFWQIPLAEESRPLTTFLTPFGRFWFNKLPFGISSAPEHFQKQMSRVLEGLDGVVCQIDDILVHGSDQSTHDQRLKAVLDRLQSRGVTLNREKCSFNQRRLKFLGHMIDGQGISADPDKIAAIRDMEPPSNLSELRRFLGMTTQLGKFSPNLADLTQPLRELLHRKNSWLWGPAQEKAFVLVKDELTKPSVLLLYDPLLQTKVTADASSFGLGAVLSQKDSADRWRPVSFASRALSDTEKRYAQIEKEALAVTWASEKFQDFVLGKEFTIETDHKPLVPLLNSKNLDNLPPRVLRFRLRLARFNYQVEHKPGKLLYTADTLSRAPVFPPPGDQSGEQEVEQWMITAVQSIPASEQRLEKYSLAQKEDKVCTLLLKFCKTEWPPKQSLDKELKPYWDARHKISVEGKLDLLLYGSRIIVPLSMQASTLDKLHEGHQGIQRCRLRAQESVWWPGISSQIKDKIQRCPTCAELAINPVEPMIPSSLPDRPWQKLGADLFYYRGKNYLLVVDYYSRYPEVAELSSTTSRNVISALKSMFSRHGIPDLLHSDNGPQFSSEELNQFAKSYDFELSTSSPYYPQGNGLVERMVKTIKSLFNKSEDRYLSLLIYRSTPLPWCGLSPSSLLMGRQPRSTLPQINSHLTPDWSHLISFPENDMKFKEKQKQNYDSRHRVHFQNTLPEGTTVWIKSDKRPTQGTIHSDATTPRSYWVDTPSGKLRRNRRHLTVVPPNTVSRDPIITRSKTKKGRCDRM